jgi:hypothetical protein
MHGAEEQSIFSKRASFSSTFSPLSKLCTSILDLSSGARRARLLCSLSMSGVRNMKLYRTCWTAEEERGVRKVDLASARRPKEGSPTVGMM